jgi:hypothetical protein
MNEIIKIDKILLDNLCSIIDKARQQVAVSVSNTMTMMYWHIGDTIRTYVLEGQRAAYGQQIVSTLSTKLTELYGKDFTDRNSPLNTQPSQN